MKVVVERVNKAKVLVEEKTIAEIKKGLLVLVGVGDEDTEKEVDLMAKKIVRLRIFADVYGKMNQSIKEISGQVLAVPQFTLLAELKGQNRPYFGQAAKPEKAERLFNYFVRELKQLGIKKVETGKFGAYMQVELVNDGPVTIIIDSDKF